MTEQGVLGVDDLARALAAPVAFTPRGGPARTDHPDAELLRWHNENVFEKGIAA